MHSLGGAVLAGLPFNLLAAQVLYSGNYLSSSEHENTSKDLFWLELIIAS